MVIKNSQPQELYSKIKTNSNNFIHMKLFKFTSGLYTHASDYVKKGEYISLHSDIFLKIPIPIYLYQHYTYN